MTQRGRTQTQSKECRVGIQNVAGKCQRSGCGKHSFSAPEQARSVVAASDGTQDTAVQPSKPCR